MGIRSQNIFAKQFHETTKIIKEFKQDTIVVAGGPYITMDFKEVAKDQNVDYFVTGEGEVTFTELVERLLNGQSPLDVKGLAYRDNGKITMNAPRPFIDDLNSLPFPDYNLISIDKYSSFLNYGFNRKRQAIIVSSRGCPYRCIFCHRMFGQKFRARSAQNVFTEIAELYKNFGIKDFYFVDDSFNLDYQRAMDLFDLIITNKMKINMCLIIRGDIIDHSFIDKMVEAGVICVLYPLETASQRLQKFIKKFVNLEKLADAIHYTCEKNIIVNCSFMVGFPTETKEEALQTIEYLKQFKKIVMPVFNSVKYYPNTEIYDLALQDGIRLGDIRYAHQEPFHDIEHSGTPLIPKSAFRNIQFKFLQEIILSKERLLNAIEIQRRFFTEKEILDFYSLCLKRKVTDLEKDLLRYAK